jgi:hypothetical protein
MKPKHIIAFLGLFLITLAAMQSLIELSWKEATFISYLKDVWKNVVSLFFSLLIAIPITVILQKKYEKNDRK